MLWYQKASTSNTACGDILYILCVNDLLDKRIWHDRQNRVFSNKQVDVRGWGILPRAPLFSQDSPAWGRKRQRRAIIQYGQTHLAASSPCNISTFFIFFFSCFPCFFFILLGSFLDRARWDRMIGKKASWLRDWLPDYPPPLLLLSPCACSCLFLDLPTSFIFLLSSSSCFLLLSCSSVSLPTSFSFSCLLACPQRWKAFQREVSDTVLWLGLSQHVTIFLNLLL